MASSSSGRFLLAALVLTAGGTAEPLVGGEEAGAGAEDALVVAAAEFFRSHAGNASSAAARGDYESAVPAFGEIHAALRPVAVTLPPNEDGLLGPTAVRYMLHRLFVQEHSWFVEGLDPEGQAWNESSPTQAKAFSSLPPGLRALAAQRVNGPGLSLREVAAFAALLEHAIDLEATARLRAVYRKLRLPVDGSVSAAQAQSALDAYMSCHVAGQDPARISATRLHRIVGSIQEIYPSWPATQDFVRERIQHRVVDGRVDSASMGLVVQEIGRRWGNFQGSECSELKGVLMRLEDRGTGRVRLADFYGGALHEGKWQFAESIPYLRQLGALDESNPSNMRVIIPNYINGRSNCVGSTSSYSNCCVSECVSIVRHLEQQLGAPDALPEDILALVAALPSRTVPAGRSLPDLMVIRLRSIAAEHGGRVLLHSRLFSQWLHHAYPRECPYPHLSGTTKPLELGEWVSEFRTQPTASPGEMEKYAGASSSDRARRRPTGPVEMVPWSQQEELFVPPPAERPMAWVALHGAVFATAVAIPAMGITLMRTARAAQRALRAQRRPTHPPCVGLDAKV